MEIKSHLSTIGLGKSEILVYLFLLEHGLSTPPQIARGTGIQRAHCYAILESLNVQGLIATQRIKQKRLAFIARDPQALFQSVERKKEIIEQILPDLRGLFNLHAQKPKIQFFDGLSEVQAVYTLSLEATEIFGIGSTARMRERHGSFFENYQKELKRKQIVFHDILSHTSKSQAVPFSQATLKGLYEVKLLTTREGELPMDILIWDDHVALISHDDPVFGTILTNPAAGKMFRVLFHALYERIES